VGQFLFGVSDKLQFVEDDKLRETLIKWKVATRETVEA